MRITGTGVLTEPSLTDSSQTPRKKSAASANRLLPILAAASAEPLAFLVNFRESQVTNPILHPRTLQTMDLTATNYRSHCYKPLSSLLQTMDLTVTHHRSHCARWHRLMYDVPNRKPTLGIKSRCKRERTTRRRGPSHSRTTCWRQLSASPAFQLACQQKRAVCLRGTCHRRCHPRPGRRKPNPQTEQKQQS